MNERLQACEHLCVEMNESIPGNLSRLVASLVATTDFVESENVTAVQCIFCNFFVLSSLARNTQHDCFEWLSPVGYSLFTTPYVK